MSDTKVAQAIDYISSWPEDDALGLVEGLKVAMGGSDFDEIDTGGADFGESGGPEKGAEGVNDQAEAMAVIIRAYISHLRESGALNGYIDEEGDFAVVIST